MIRTILNKVRAIPAFLSRVREEPVLVLGAAMVALTAFQTAQAGGLGGEDTLILIAEALLTWLGRELVYPAVKVDAATGAVKETVEPPYIGGE